PFWSPDSRFVAFFADGKLKKIEATGGVPQTLTETPANEGGTWNRAGMILVGHPKGGLFRVSASGGQPQAVTTLDASKEASHRWPYFLPDGRHFLYIAGPPYRVYVGLLDSSFRKQLMLNSDSKAVYAPGYVLFAKEDSLMAQPFDAAKVEL